MFIVFLITNGVIASLPFLIFVDLSDTASRVIGSLLGTLLAVLLSIGFGLSAAILERYLRDEYAGPRTAWKDVWQNPQGVLACSLLSAALLLSVATLFPPMALLARPLFFGPPILMQIAVIERLPLSAAWVRSKELMRGHWGRVIAYLMTISLGVFVLDSMIFSAIAAMMGSYPDATVDAVIGTVGVLVLSITYPFIATAMYVAYADVAALEGTASAGPERKRRTPQPSKAALEEGSDDDPQPEEPHTLYEILGVRAGATQKQIRRAYDARMKLLDPARHQDRDPDEIKMIDIRREETQAAYAVLSDPEARVKYDEDLDS